VTRRLRPVVTAEAALFLFQLVNESADTSEVGFLCHYQFRTAWELWQQAVGPPAYTYQDTRDSS
jgi:hypothetical protein